MVVYIIKEFVFVVVLDYVVLLFGGCVQCVGVGDCIDGCIVCVDGECKRIGGGYIIYGYCLVGF